jgi:hypothetical protein
MRGNQKKVLRKTYGTYPLKISNSSQCHVKNPNVTLILKRQIIYILMGKIKQYFMRGIKNGLGKTYGTYPSKISNSSQYHLNNPNVTSIIKSQIINILM